MVWDTGLQSYRNCTFCQQLSFMMHQRTEHRSCLNNASNLIQELFNTWLPVARSNFAFLGLVLLCFHSLQIAIGDTISWVGVEPDRMTRVEALDWDQTINAIGSFVDERRVSSSPRTSSHHCLRLQASYQ